MFLSYRGKGFWVLFIAFFGAGGAQLGAERLGLLPLLPTRSTPLAIGCFLTGMICLVWGLILNAGPPIRAVDRLTGLVVTIKTRHSLYGIAMQYWGVLFLLIAALLALYPPS
jgi:hypothetical protein